MGACGGALRLNGREARWGVEATAQIQRSLYPEGALILWRQAPFAPDEALIVDDLVEELRLALQVMGLTLGLLRLRRAHEAQAQELSQFNARKREILRTISHELRTPLATIEGFATTMLQDETMPAEVRVEFLQIVCDEAQRMRGMVDDVLSLSRQNAGRLTYDFQALPLPQLLQDAVDRLQLQAKSKGLSLELDVIDEVYCRLDPLRMMRVLINLLENAIKYTEAGGVHVSVWREDGWAYFSVRDTGIGIPQLHLPFVFERFYRVEDAGLGGEGLGLGLALAEGIVKDHGGQIRVESVEGEGASFIVSLKALDALGSGHLQ
ncbi:HAMP domain-containing histidine kinase [Myxococcota bacterium]|nr:HAMP domain-containing histidine kinase [Myxococcota bacterium]MBU1899779.1 HAMP domain-containing histidine kinase [Myxococcota bacterium]